MNNETYNLFVYGSLRSGFHHPVYEYLAKYFHLIGDATVKSSLYDMGDYPVAIPTTHDKLVTGELYTANSAAEFDYAIVQLDDYEGLNVEVGERPLYKRAITTVNCNGQDHTAWIYWYNGVVDGLPEIASGDILQYMQQKNKP